MTYQDGTGFRPRSVGGWLSHVKSIREPLMEKSNCPGIPTTIKTMGVNITTIVYLKVLIIQIGSTIILMVVEAQGICKYLDVPLEVRING